jgi:phospholipase/carboxylesterase
MSEIISAGLPLDQASKVAILIHGRGASASGILTLRDHLNLDDFALLAPEVPQKKAMNLLILWPSSSSGISRMTCIIQASLQNRFT